MIFANREAAGRALAKQLAHLADLRPLVLAVPRGGVPVGRAVADALGGDFDIVLVHKLGAPGNPEYAVGAVDETGRMIVSTDAWLAGASADYLEREKDWQLTRMRVQREQFSKGRAPFDPTGRTVIVVDDGLATGATMRVALRSLRTRNPARLVCAVPVAPPDTLESLREECDELVCLEAPPEFRAVGQFYANFDQVDDEEVSRLLG